MKKNIGIICALALALCLCSCAEPLSGAAENKEVIELTAAVKTITAKYSGENVSFELDIPEGWSFEEYSGGGSCGLVFTPAAAPELQYSLLYYERGFGVCGTGLKSKSVEFDGSGLEASVGYYDGSSLWSFAAFNHSDDSYALTWSAAGGSEPDDSVVSACHNEMLSALGRLRFSE